MFRNMNAKQKICRGCHPIEFQYINGSENSFFLNSQAVVVVVISVLLLVKSPHFCSSTFSIVRSVKLNLLKASVILQSRTENDH